MDMNMLLLPLLKLCTKCIINRPYNEFSKDKSAKDGLNYHCKLCRSKSDKQYRFDNDVKIKQKKQLHYIKNAEYYKKQMKDYYQQNPDKFKQYRLDNADSIKEKYKQYSLDNADKIKQRTRRHYIINAEQHRQYRLDNKDRQRQYYVDNKDRLKEICKSYRQGYVKTERGRLIRKADGHKRRVLLRINTPFGKHFTADDLKLKLILQKFKCIYCTTSIRNYYEIDHFIPAIKGGSNESSNIQLLCRKCNGAGGKGAKMPYEYAQEHGKLL